MNVRIVLGVVASLSALITGSLGIVTAVDPLGTTARFGIDLGGVDLGALMPTFAACLISLAAFTALAARWVFAGRAAGRTLALLGGVSLLLVALLGGIVGGSPQILALDGIRGLLIAGLAALWKPAP